MADATPKDATLKECAAVLRKPGETLTSFSANWKALSPKDKEDLKRGIGNGTMTY